MEWENAVGDLGHAIPEGAYRTAAKLLADQVATIIVDLLKDTKLKEFARYVESDAGKAVVGYGLAGILEVMPTTSLQVERQRVAYNLRVGTYATGTELLVVPLLGL